MTPDELRKIREHTGLSQEKLAHLIGKTRSTVAKAETGNVPVTRTIGLLLRLIDHAPQILRTLSQWRDEEIRAPRN